ncbi:MAG: FGGY family carbohydrate kinase [Planctomycetota bacterium]
MLALGIDIGTSKVAVALIDSARVQVHVASAAHQAALVAPAGRYEQDAVRIIACAEALVLGLPTALRAQVGSIGFTGQMHGVVLHDAHAQPLSPLITWQDQRTLEDPGFLNRLGRSLHAGYGLATLAWLTQLGAVPADARAATIHGLLAARWGGLARSPIDPTDAQAWGGLEPLANMNAGLLPTAVDHGARIGNLAIDIGLPRGIPLAAPLGDNQASLRATLTDPDRELAFTLGTGCQLSAVVPRGSCTPIPGCDVRPFDATRDALVAAPLVGGAAWLWLADTVASWVTDLGLSPPSREVIFARLDELGLAAADRLDFHTHLAGERHDPALTGVLTGISLNNGSLGEIARALARGLTAVPRSMLPASSYTGRTRVMASGNALRHSRLLLAMAESEFALPIVLNNCREEAATGAAYVARALITSL